MKKAYGHAYSIRGESLAIWVSLGKCQGGHTWDRTNFTALVANPMIPSVKTGGKQMPIKAWKNMLNLWHQRLDQTSVRKEWVDVKEHSLFLYVSLPSMSLLLD